MAAHCSPRRRSSVRHLYANLHHHDHDYDDHDHDHDFIGPLDHQLPHILYPYKSGYLRRN